MSNGPDPPDEMVYLASPVDAKGAGSLVFALPHWLRTYLEERGIAKRGEEAVELTKLMPVIPGADLIQQQGDSANHGLLAPIGRLNYRVFWTTCRQSGWKVIFNVSEANVWGPVLQTARKSLVIDLFGLAAMLWLLGAIADRVIGPVRRLTQAAAQVEAGHYTLDELRPVLDHTDEFGQLARVFQSMADKVAEREAGLDRRVRLRTAELETALEELRSAKEATDQAMMQQKVFLGNVAHDLRTPLTVVMLCTEDLLRRAHRGKQEAFIPDLQVLMNRGNELLEFINDLLNLSRSMGEKLIELSLEEFDVETTLRFRMEGIGWIAEQNGNVFEFRTAKEGVGRMVADKVKVWRILMNLLTNACKFTHNGTITLMVARERVRNEDRIVFRVRDTGKGISPEVQRTLFQRFVQAKSSSGRLTPGVGLGLSICLLYCKTMGGEVTVESEEGKGSVFTVTLPVTVRPQRPEPSSATPSAAQVPAPPAAFESPATPAPNAASSREAGLVLIVDDDASVVDLIRRNLIEEGFKARTARDGEEGIRLAKQLLPSAIILDIIMPGIDGWEVMAALKADARTAEIPIIVASILEERERGFRLGAQEYVTKPLLREHLSELLSKHLGDRPPARILVVEDDDDTRDDLHEMLRNQGWEVLTASGGEDALGKLEPDPPDLILLDLMIPTIDRRKLVAAIRNTPDWQSIPVVVMTAAELSPEDVEQLQGQVDHIVSKSLYDCDELFREIRYLIAVRRLTPASITEPKHG